MDTSIFRKSAIGVLTIMVSFFFSAAGEVKCQTLLRPLFPDADPICSCESLLNINISNTKVDSAITDLSGESCSVTVTVTHPPANDKVKIYISLPLKNWNGRFMGTGGGGYVGGNPKNLARWVSQGFVAAATNTGHEGGSASFALNEQNKLNWQEIRDNAYLGIHEMTVMGKRFTEAFYGKQPGYSYFIGNSTGGRQGLIEALRYPMDYDGILSRCPAINWHRFIPATVWPQVVMLDNKNFVSNEKLKLATKAAVASCDGDDGVIDEVIDNPLSCRYDPKQLVGTRVGDDLFTEADAEIVSKIWQGARSRNGRFLWYGLTRGTSLISLANTEGTPLKGNPFHIGLGWLKYFLVQDHHWDWTTLTHKKFERLWKQSVKQYGDIFGSDDPDLAPFRDRGGKLIITHGLADELITPQGTIDLYGRVQKKMGGPQHTSSFVRLFLAPGVDHGFKGAGPSPTGDAQALFSWVEEGQAPDSIIAEKLDKDGNIVRTRPLFPYPAVAKYKGSGSPDDAANFISSTPDK